MAIVLQYHLILIHILLLAWMIVFIMANAGTMHAKIVLTEKGIPPLYCMSGHQ